MSDVHQESDYQEKHKYEMPKNFHIKAGSQYEMKVIVKEEDLATHLKTGKVPFISTAMMIVYMEQCCVALIDHRLPIGFDSVSTEMNVRHLHTAKPGDELLCRAHLKFVSDNKLFFDVAMIDHKGTSVGIGAHERYIVCHKSFIEKNS